jgi:hypothetical protein
MRRGVRGSSRGDEGVVIALVALLMVALLIIVALVIDLGYLRGGASLDQSSADLAALAGGEELGRGNYVGACEDIIGYVNSNAAGIPAITASTFCAGMSSTVCSGGGLAQAAPTQTSGRYTISIHFPVPDAEIADPTFGAGMEDGTPCERMRVLVTSEEPSFFGGIVGRSSYTTTRSATMRAAAGRTITAPALWLLDPVSCVALSVSGGSSVIVGDVISNPIVPGLVTIDSDGSSGCSATKTTIDVSGSGSRITALPATGTDQGVIALRALPAGATTCAGSFACKQSQVGVNITPQPIPAAERATRAPVDWRVNCKSSYPAYFGTPVEPCPDAATKPAYIDRLVSGTTGVGSSGQPAGFQRWTTTHSCAPPGVTVVTGNWWVDCPGDLSIGNGTTVTFSNGNVVLDGGIKLTSGGTVNFNTANGTANLPASCVPPALAIPCISSASDAAAFMYMRSGDLNLGGGAFNGRHTMVYLSPSSFVKGSGGSPPSWTAPTEGPFAGLALWAEASGAFNISGGSGVTLQGSFFTPFADELSLSGGGTWGQQHAQFISYRLKVTGGSSLTMAPDEFSFQLPPEAGVLIR